MDEAGDAGKNIGDIKYGPHKSHPTLKLKVQNSFSRGTFTETVLKEDTVMYRVSGGNSGKLEAI